ncbi:MAG: low-complexity protein [Gammaproteobacteria bacterium]|nr:MAG: low-complexity protein [Gammaproteobacteria bacterium]
MLKVAKKPIAALIGSTFMATLGLSSGAYADTNPFTLNELEGGYQLAAADAEGKCGEAKCGAETDSKDAEGSCGAGAEEKGAEGKCGEGKCGSA